MAEKKPGLVQKLMFPAYADAGSNDAFQAPDNETQSQATTAVLDNRFVAQQLRQQQQETNGSLAISIPESRPPLNEKRVSEKTDGNLAIATTAPRTRFFPSTDPSSPLPKPSRVPPARSSSITTQNGATSSLTEMEQHNNSKDGSSSPPLPKPSRAPPVRSSSIVTHSGATSSQTEIEQKYSEDGSSTAMDQSSMTASSGMASSVLGGLNFLPDKEEESEAAQRDEVKEPETPQKDNRSVPLTEETPQTDNRSARKTKEEQSTDLSESEMEPPQSPFHPALALRLAQADDAVSDVNSTSSEMGTVVGAPGRLQEVEAMAALVELSSPETNDHDALYTSPKTPSAANVDELSLPVLEEGPTRGGSLRFEHTKTVSAMENPSTSSMVSAAFRRLGDNLKNRSSPTQTTTASVSAPTTPRTPKVEEYLRSSLLRRSDEKQPASSTSLLLRSPGSAAHFMPDGKRRFAKGSKPALTPRFSQREEPQKMINTRSRGDTSPVLRQASSLTTKLRYARGCLSFDNTLEEPTFAITDSVPEEEILPPSTDPSSPIPRMAQSQSWDGGFGFTSKEMGPSTPNAYQSFHFGTSYSMDGDAPSAFRPARLDTSRVRYANGTEFQGLKKPPADLRVNTKDFSPAVLDTRNALALRTPQRIEIEREDALDILACLVERSAAFGQELGSTSKDGDGEVGPDNVAARKESTTPQNELLDENGVSAFVGAGDQRSDVITSPPKTRRKTPTAMHIMQTDSFTELSDAVSAMRVISQQYEQEKENASEQGIDHEARMKAVDELLRSHTYATEMRRAAQSASVWLRSIGRQVAEDGGVVQRIESRDSARDSDSASNKEPSGSDVRDRSQASGEGNSEVTRPLGDIDLLSLKAMLHSAELKAKEKEEYAQRLNEELSKCRAEIGRLKSSSRAEAIFQSPNRSILDNDDDSTVSTDVSKGVEPGSLLEDIMERDASPIPKAEEDGDLSFEASFCQSEVQGVKKEEWSTLADAKKEAVLLKAALAEANGVIRRLHDEGQPVSDTSKSIAPPVVSISNPELSKELDEYKIAVKNAYEAPAGSTSRRNDTKTASEVASPGATDRRTVNVKMLDGENFITDWDDLAPSLPPPPDHGLRSPIVAALLQQWTSDANMHESLLSWMERIMNGADPDTVPPLTISSLDHQVRDGFAMHVLPLLLRRSDIRVDIKTRAHRRTTYDMSVAITHPVSLASQLGAATKTPEAPVVSMEPPLAPSTLKPNKAHVMAYRATRSGNSDTSTSDAETFAERQAKVSEYLRTSSYAQSSEAGASSVAHSSITERMTNSSKVSLERERRLSPETESRAQQERDREALMPHYHHDDLSVGSSTTGGSSQKSSQQLNQAGLMGTLSGAFGLLRRSNKPPTSVPVSMQTSSSPMFDVPSQPSVPVPPEEAVPSFLRNAAASAGQEEEQEENQDQPYHRVVSAPPGRIGVTFVEYRGHAMVSAVAPDSPLSGWVYPSDILIAIDEVAVSGMRVRDIVKLLTNRRERQRALRMISSHAMTEFTLNTTTLSEVGAPS